MLLNKTDLMTDDAIDGVARDVGARLRDGVRMVRTANGRIDPGILLGLDAAAEDDLAARPSHHDADGEHDHDDFESFEVDLGEIAEPAGLISRIGAAVAAHDILRVKGFACVAGKDMRLIVQGVGARVQHYFDRPWIADEPRSTRLVVIGLTGLDRAAIATRTQRLADELEMHEFLDRRCEKFSTGMKQKTSIARTLIHDPPVMIFDEPTLGLDVMAARTIVRFVHDCRARGKAVIYSTHVMSEVEKLCDVIGILHDGRLLAEGTLAQLRERTGEADLEEIFVQIVGGERNP